MKPRIVKRRSFAEDKPLERSDPELLEAVEKMSEEEIARRLQEKLTSGAYPRSKKLARIIETVDLHGLTSDEAIKQLRTALRGLCGRDGWVQVLVGKGIHSPDGIAVLRESIPSWLDGAGRALVAEWRWAKPREGGRGALLVRLRRPPSAQQGSTYR